jgi:cyclic pyranopterin phosphate synthase
MDMIARPKPVTIEVKVTNRCNQFCSFCMNNDSSRSSGELNTPRFLERLDAWASDPDPSLPRPGELRMTGGEPLLRLGAVESIAVLCQRQGIKCGVNTNGLLIKQKTADRLKAVNLQVIKISLDSLDTDILRSIR